MRARQTQKSRDGVPWSLVGANYRPLECLLGTLLQISVRRVLQMQPSRVRREGGAQPFSAAALFWSYAIHHPRRPHIGDSNRKTVMMIPGFMKPEILTPVNGRIATGESPGRC